MINKIKTLYKGYKGYLENGGELSFANWLIKENQFYLFGRYIDHKKLSDIDFYTEPST